MAEAGGGGATEGTVKAATTADLHEQVKQLFDASGAKARLVLKYRHCDGKVSLRATNDKRTIKYKTPKTADIKGINGVLGWVITGAEPPTDMEIDTPEGSGHGTGSGKRRRDKRAKKG